MPALGKMVAALAESEQVHINVCDEEHEEEVRAALRVIARRHCARTFFRIPTNEPWCRDHGPIFVSRETRNPRLAVVDWDYNAWGWKYPPFELDDAVPQADRDELGLTLFNGGIVLEGGSIEVNGAGTLLTTESLPAQSEP